MTKILITGCAGFIGFHLSKELSKKNKIIGIDNLNKYYDVSLKKNRLNLLKKNFKFYKLDIVNKKKLTNVFIKEKPDIVINLAAQAGVRYSITNPDAYTNSNVIGFFNILNLCKEFKVSHFLFASTSSVYGDQKKMPIKENYSIFNPIQYYAATKAANELMATSYSNLYNLKITGMRFFTVYGPWGRPDMALFRFTEGILKNKKINVYNHGLHSRDFTYVDDCVKGIIKLIKRKNLKKKNFDVFNIANGKSEKLSEFIKIIEKTLNLKSRKNLLALQRGDIKKTFASIKKIKSVTNYSPKVSIQEGIPNFVAWYKDYYNL